MAVIPAFAEEPQITFAKDYLGLDVTTLRFSQIAQTNNTFGITATPLHDKTVLNDLSNDPSVIWMTNSISEKYHQTYNNRLLRYAVRDGRIVGVHISLLTYQFATVTSSDDVERRQKVDSNRNDLFQVNAGLIKLHKLEKANPETHSLNVRTVFNQCGDILHEIQITPNVNSITQDRH